MSESLIDFFMRAFFVFEPLVEPLAPPFISFFLRRRMKEWREEGLFDDYEVKTKRMKRLHYKVDIDLDLTHGQFSNLFCKTLEKMKRM